MDDPETKNEFPAFGRRFFGGIIAGIGVGLANMIAMSFLEGIDPLDWWAYFWIFILIGGSIGSVIGMFWAMTALPVAKTPRGSNPP